MAVTYIDGGDFLGVLSSNETITTISTPGVYTFRFGLTKMQNGDAVTLTHFGQVHGSQNVTQVEFTDAQDQGAYEMVVVVDDDSWGSEIQAEQTTGTARLFPWRLVKVA